MTNNMVMEEIGILGASFLLWPIAIYQTTSYHITGKVSQPYKMFLQMFVA